jgi:WD40 repeat protein
MIRKVKTNSFSNLFISFFLEVSVCSVASRNGYCVAGTRDNEIYGFELNGNTNPQLIVQGHHDNSLSALACHPRENIFVTGGDDCSLRFEEN